MEYQVVRNLGILYMITKIIYEFNTVIISEKYKQYIYINDIAPENQIVQNIINNIANMKWHINNVIWYAISNNTITPSKLQINSYDN